jgi:cell wall-associated NlpC family hydrolase
MAAGRGALGRAALLAGLTALMSAGAGQTAAPALARGTPGGVASTKPTPELPEAGAPQRALLVDGRAVAPLDAPPAVRLVIRAANRIRAKPYVWGGGHAAWAAVGYDCSGSVSYALHGGRLLSSPLVSGAFMRWGAPGPGRWITIYANREHVYAVIAGLRWDTVGDSHGSGPRWHVSPPYPKGFVVRHPVGY